MGHLQNIPACLRNVQVCGAMSNSPLPACSHIMLSPRTASSLLAAALPRCAGELVQQEEVVVVRSPSPPPHAPHFYLHPAHTFLPLCVCMCVRVRLGAAWSTRSAAALLSGSGVRSPPADAGVNTPWPAAEHGLWSAGWHVHEWNMVDCF